MELIFGTHNNNKLIEIHKLLPSGYMLKSLTDLNYDSEIEETGLTLEENALIKARTIFNTFKKDSFADDSGLEVSALGGKPGVFSARYAGNHRNAEDNTQKILREMKGITDRQAQFRTVIALIVEGTEYLFEGIIKGEISNSPLGQNGFGYDPIFIPEKQPLTFAQLTLYEKNKISHRSRAFEKLVEFLKR
jgi:XTP/dITP diphosphohydrolase